MQTRKPRRENKWNDAEALCPFFRMHNATQIRCEGPVNGSVLTLFFRATGKKRQQYAEACCEKYKECAVYRANMARYEHGEK